MDFQDGQTRVIGGVTYVRQGGVWHPQTPMAPARQPAPQTAPQVQQDQLQVAHLQQQIDQTPLQNESTRVNIDQNRQSMQNQRFNQNQGLRQEYNALPEVKNYSAAVGSLGTALKAPDTSQGDLAVVYAYAKAMDPGSVVREGEMDMARATASIPQQYQAYVAGLTQGKRLPPQVRTGLVETMRQSVGGLRQTYDQQRGRYGDLARKDGFDPAEIVGQPLYDAYRPAEEDYIRAHGGTPKVEGVPVGAPAGGDEVKFNDELAGRSRSQEFHDSFYQALSSKQLRSTNDINAWVEQFNQQHNTGYKIDWKNPETKKGIAAAISGKQFNVENPVDPRVGQRVQELQQTGTGAGAAFNVGAKDALTAGFAPRIAAVGDALGGSLGGEGSFSDLYDMNLDANRQYMTGLQQNHGLAYAAGEIGGGAMIPGFGARTPGQFAALGGALGTTVGANQGDSNTPLVDRAMNASIGGVTGATLGYAVPKGLSMLPKKAANVVPDLVDPTTGTLNEPLEAAGPASRVQAAKDFGIDMPMGAAGDKTAAIVERKLDVRPASAGIMNDHRRIVEGQVQNAVEGVADQYGQSRTLNEAGSEIQKAANARIERGKTVIGKAYDAIPIADTAQASTSSAVATLRKLTGRFQSNAGLAESLKDPKLKGYLDALEKGGISWQDLKDFRSLIGEKIGDMRFGEGSRTSDLRALYAGLSEDMRTTAAQMGPPATRAFERANTLNRQNEELIDGALTRLLGNDGKQSPEKAASIIQSMTKGGKSTGDLKTLAQIRSATVKSGAWDEISGALIRIGGKPADSPGRGFDPATFVKWYSDMAEPARAMLFKPELRKSLDQFVAVSQRLANSNALRNTSNTAMASPTGTFSIPTAFAALFTGHPVVAAGIVAGTAAKTAGEYGMAKLWTNTSFVNLLTGYGKAAASGNPNAVSSQLGRISKLAATNPELREPIEALLKKIANDNTVSKVAASPNSEGEQNQQ